MAAALGHLQEAKAALEKATPNKGGHREKAMQLVDQASQLRRSGEEQDLGRTATVAKAPRQLRP